MKRKAVIVTVTALVLVAGTYLVLHGFTGKSQSEYEFATITTGDIENTVTASGTLSPTTTVEVGTQVSGTIDRVLVDFNGQVSEDQILAVLDTSLLKAAVLDAEANLERAQAQLEQTTYEWQRSAQLFERDLISEAEFLTAEVELKTQKAAVKSAETTLDRAERNLQYAVIRSPISGIVIDRSVEEGQTVAASLSTPTLFVIAQSLDRMEILVDVDESDIGQIKAGQDVRFEVTAYSDEVFTGDVTQIRLQPQTVSNVVTYTVVVDASNDRGLLLPGMTATVDFIIEESRDVLLVPAQALRFQPNPEQAREAFEKLRRQRPERGQAPQGADSTRSGPLPPRPNPQERQHVWVVDSAGELVVAPLVTGLSDGKNTEIRSSPLLTDGQRVIIGLKSGDTESEAASENKRPRGFGPPRF